MEGRGHKLAVSLATFIVAAAALLSSPGIGAQEPGNPVRDVEVRLFLIDVESINDASQSFTANLAIVMRWRDPDLAHSGPGPISMPLDSIWYPSLQILNQQKLVTPFPQVAEVSLDGEVVYRQRYWGSFSQRLDLRNFPFDAQRLQFTLANVGFAAESVNLRPSADSGISEKFSLPDWDIAAWGFEVVDLPFDDGSYHIEGMEFSLDVKRDTSFFKYKVILPLVLIVVMSWLVFWIDLSMIEVIYTAYLSTNGQLEQARALDRKARLIVPLIYIPLALGALSFGVWQ